MLKRLNPFRPPTHAVLSLEVQAHMPDNERVHGRFEVLVRHLLGRFFNNELISTDDEVSRAILLGYLISLPGLVVALFLSAPYHVPLGRAFWSQVGDHYFFVMYSMIVMGAITVYEWDLLFPDLLDIFILSVLPIGDRRLFMARIAAIAVFLGLVLLGTNSLGAVFLPLVADLPSLRVHLFAHAAAVIMGGSFTAAAFLALHGVLLNVLGERMFRRITPLLQGISISVFLAVLFAFPALSYFLKTLLSSDNAMARWFPPFWFLGIYERILEGSATLPIFKELAKYGCVATLLTIVLVLVTYPLTYRRRVRYLIEGSGAMSLTSWRTRHINRLLHATVLRQPASRAVFHFVSQTLLRTQKHRVLLAMYGGLGIAIALADMVTLTVSGGHVRVAFMSAGIQAAVPVMTFWTVAGLRTALAAPVNRRGSWIFRMTIGRAGLEHLNGAKIWVAAWGFTVSMATVATLYLISPAALRTPLAMTGEIIVAIGLSLLATDCLFLKTMTIPFTELRKTSITDMPLLIIRYFVVLPILALILVYAESRLMVGVSHLVETMVVIALAHIWLRWRYKQRVEEVRSGSDFEDGDELFQRLGLTD